MCIKEKRREIIAIIANLFTVLLCLIDFVFLIVVIVSLKMLGYFSVGSKRDKVDSWGKLTQKIICLENRKNRKFIFDPTMA